MAATRTPAAFGISWRAVRLGQRRPGTLQVAAQHPRLSDRHGERRRLAPGLDGHRIQAGAGGRVLGEQGVSATDERGDEARVPDSRADQVGGDRLEVDAGTGEVVDHGDEVGAQAVARGVVQDGATHQRRDVPVAAEDAGVDDPVEQDALLGRWQRRERWWDRPVVHGVAGTQGENHLVHRSGQAGQDPEHLAFGAGRLSGHRLSRDRAAVDDQLGDQPGQPTGGRDQGAGRPGGSAPPSWSSRLATSSVVHGSREMTVPAAISRSRTSPEEPSAGTGSTAAMMREDDARPLPSTARSPAGSRWASSTMTMSGGSASAGTG